VAYYNEGHQTQVEIIGWDVNHHAGQFVGSFCCTTEGRQMAQQLLDAGADIILPVAGQSVGWGAAAQVKEHGEAWMIGVDTDWTVTAPEFTNIMLTSIEKRFDVSVQRAAASVAEGNFSGGDHLGTLATDEVGIAPFHTLDGMVSDQVKAELEQIKAAIIAGEIKTR
jgi:basic membrane protein A